MISTTPCHSPCCSHPAPSVPYNFPLIKFGFVTAPACLQLHRLCSALLCSSQRRALASHPARRQVVGSCPATSLHCAGTLLGSANGCGTAVPAGMPYLGREDSSSTVANITAKAIFPVERGLVCLWTAVLLRARWFSLSFCGTSRCLHWLRA